MAAKHLILRQTGAGSVNYLVTRGLGDYDDDSSIVSLAGRANRVAGWGLIGPLVGLLLVLLL